MLLPMMGFFMTLIVVGASGSLIAIADLTRAKLFPFTLAMLFSGAGVYILAFGLGYAGGRLFGPSTISDILFLIGLLVGSVGGAIRGYLVGTRRNRRIRF